MEYSKIYKVKPEHIDAQQIMDGLYYPFYMEDCRHAFIKDVLGFDLIHEAENGTLMVLSQYTIKFVRSLKENDEFKVTCSIMSDQAGLPRLHFKQEIILNGKIMTTAIFTGTCISKTGGRPFLPQAIEAIIAQAPAIDIQLLK